MIDPDDWRLLTGNAETLRGATLFWRPWRQERPHWDHDHCAFCMAKFCDERIPDALHEGFTTADNRWWICRPCAEEFSQHCAFKFAATGTT